MNIFELFQENYTVLLNGLGITLQITLISLVIATVLGVVFGLLNVSHFLPLKAIAGLYIDIIRGTPVLVQAFFIYFGLPTAFGFRLDAMTAGIITLSLNAGAYMAEIVRAGIQSVDSGQMEAARSLGLSYSKAMGKVILPQALRTMTPSIINQFIITLKDTSILSVIGIRELTQNGKIIIAKNYESMRMWAIVAIMYFVVITILSKISKEIERRTSYGK